jgi:cell division control protein 42
MIFMVTRFYSSLIFCIPQEDFAHLRPLCYPQVNAAVVCFSVINRESFEHVKDKWVKELQHHCPKVPIVLVGTQTDKREALKSTKSKLAQSHVVTKSEGIKMALFIKAATYMECSALNHHNVQNVFNETVLAALGLGSDKALPTHSQCTPCAIL